MKYSDELIVKISPRHKRVREENFEFLWKDFLQAVEKVINKLSDKQFAATKAIRIWYFTNEGDKNIYRSKIAECLFFEDLTVEYEEEDTCLGTKEMLEIAFYDFKEEVDKDENINSAGFNLNDFWFDGNNKISLYFRLLPEL